MSELTKTAWQDHRIAVLNYLRRRLRDPSLAEDLTQETFLRLHHAQPDIAEPAQLRAWLLRTAQHLLIDQVRAAKPRQSLDEVGELRAEEPPTWRAFEPCIEPLAARLPQDYRAALLWDLDGVPQQEIADRQAVGLSGAKSRVQRARGLLAQELARCCGDDPETARSTCPGDAGPCL